MVQIHQPAVAGQFYPADAETLTAIVEGFLDSASTRADRPVQAVIVPHAGYVFSGAVAAEAYAGISPAAVYERITGRTAADWIDSYVITEAKNMLRYSEMSIKEIIEALHFSDQSSFTKFFRKRTGQTPRQYGQTPRQYRIGPRPGTSA